MNNTQTSDFGKKKMSNRVTKRGVRKIDPNKRLASYESRDNREFVIDSGKTIIAKTIAVDDR